MQAVVVNAEVMRDFVDDRNLHLADDVLVGLADGFDGLLEESNLVGQNHVVVVAVGEGQALVQAEKEVPVLDTGTDKLLPAGCVVHNDVNIVETHAQVFGDAVESLNDEAFKLGSCHAGKCSRKRIGGARKRGHLALGGNCVSALVVSSYRLLGGALLG